MSWYILALSTLPIISTLIGGFVVLRWKKDLHPWLSLSGGLLLGVAFLDLLPEAVTRGTENGLPLKLILGVTLVAILVFHLLDKALSFHAPHVHVHGEPDEHCDNDHHRKTKAWIRGFSMCFHSLLDGVAIGGGFAADYRLGLIVTLAVITHDFSDGMSTVTVLKHGLGPDHRGITPLLVLDALAPFVGAILGTWLALSSSVIALLLATFAGFFIFLSLSELLPQAHAGTMSRKFGLSLTALGILIVIFIQTFASV
jgi:ZIP family zinc transporter